MLVQLLSRAAAKVSSGEFWVANREIKDPKCLSRFEKYISFSSTG